MWFASAEESWIHAGIAVFVGYGLAISAVRLVLFAARHRKYGVARARSGAERAGYVAFNLLLGGAMFDCIVRWIAPGVYERLLPWHAVETRATVAAAMILMIVGGTFAFLAQSRMGRSWRIGITDEPTELVVGGIYGRIRHPIYAGFLAYLAGLVALLPNALSLAVFAGAFLQIHAWVAMEEKHQLARHGDVYRDYCSNTGRFFPRFGRRG